MGSWARGAAVGAGGRWVAVSGADLQVMVLRPGVDGRNDLADVIGVGQEVLAPALAGRGTVAIMGSHPDRIYVAASVGITFRAGNSFNALAVVISATCSTVMSRISAIRRATWRT